MGPADDGLATPHGRLERILPLPVTLDSAAVSRASTSDPSAVVPPGPHSPLGTSPLPAGDVTAAAAPVPRLQYLTGFVYAINEQGEAAGGSVSDGQTMPTVFKNGIAMVILGLPGFAVGINSAASVVGSYQPAGNSRKHLFRWSADAGAFDLTPDGYHYAEPAAINNRGDILGFGETVSGKSEYFLLTPDPNGELTPKALITAGSANVT